MTTTALSCRDAMDKPPGDDAAIPPRPLVLRILECAAIIGVPLAILVFTVIAMGRFS